LKIFKKCIITLKSGVFLKKKLGYFYLINIRFSYVYKKISDHLTCLCFDVILNVDDWILL